MTDKQTMHANDRLRDFREMLTELCKADEDGELTDELFERARELLQRP